MSSSALQRHTEPSHGARKKLHGDSSESSRLQERISQIWQPDPTVAGAPSVTWDASQRSPHPTGAFRRLPRFLLPSDFIIENHVPRRTCAVPSLLGDKERQQPRCPGGTAVLITCQFLPPPVWRCEAAVAVTNVFPLAGWRGQRRGVRDLFVWKSLQRLLIRGSVCLADCSRWRGFVHAWSRGLAYISISTQSI